MDLTLLFRMLRLGCLSSF